MMDDGGSTHQSLYLSQLLEKPGAPILALHAPLRRGVRG
jgi:hypothetical protein